MTPGNGSVTSGNGIKNGQTEILASVSQQIHDLMGTDPKVLASVLKKATGQSGTATFRKDKEEASEDWDFVKAVFTLRGEKLQHPFNDINWVRRDAIITKGNGDIVFEQRGVEFPDYYSQNAVNIITQKYFRGRLDTPEREVSLRQVVSRVASTIANWGWQQGYFTKNDRVVFEYELTHILVRQMAAFNSPVWFNVGHENEPQCSACFINSVGDSMDSILDLAVREGNIFKRGSGAGANLSNIRSGREGLSTGGRASGPVSFMRGWDAFAGAIKSGGKTRRAAKMVILDDDHLDLEEFINCKALEEKKAKLLMQHGLIKTFDEIQNSVFFQNANNSVRVHDEFMLAVQTDGDWVLRGRKDDTKHTVRAKDIFRQIAEAAWECGDPGMQFDDTINGWHTAPHTDRQRGTNPCSEYCYIDDTACNLSSINLVKFLRDDGTFDQEAYLHTVDIMLLAQEIIVDGSSYPTPRIAYLSHRHRTLGLGYTNLGMLLALKGLPYDSDEGRAYAAAVTALMHGRAYSASAAFAHRIGEGFPAATEGIGLESNSKALLNVISKHSAAAQEMVTNAKRLGSFYKDNEALFDAAVSHCNNAYILVRQHGARNAQVTLLAPTGTISFFMDSDTTGIEPAIGWIAFKALAGGGNMTIALDGVQQVLRNLGYSEKHVAEIFDYITKTNGRIVGAPVLEEKHYPVFDTAFGYSNGDIKGERAISPVGHVKMMAAVQPFLSGAISKTVNMPESATVEDIEAIYMLAWKLGVKCIALYRDNCKAVQPLTTTIAEPEGDEEMEETEEGSDHLPSDIDGYVAARWPMPVERPAVNTKLTLGGIDCYLTVGLYPDTNRPGELFVKVSKQGSLLSGVMDAFAVSVSLLLQHGIPLERLVRKFKGMKFEPNGLTGYPGREPELKTAESFIDWIFKWMEQRFLYGETVTVPVTKLYINSPSPELAETSPTSAPAEFDHDSAPYRYRTAAPPLVAEVAPVVVEHAKAHKATMTGDVCTECGSLMKRTGACKTCVSCGANTGCG